MGRTHGSSLAKTIAMLRKVIQDQNCGNMNRSGVKGYLGELLVLQQLEKEGFRVLQRGNQCGYDLESGAYRIDVKLSTTKTEVDRVTPSYGWALVHQNKKKPLSCTHFICVALDSDLLVTAYYIIAKTHVHRFPRGVSQFSGVRHGFYLLASKRPREMNGEWQTLFARSHELQRAGFVQRVLPGGSLKRALSAK